MFYGALLLTAGSILLRLGQTVFQVYLSGVLGPEGLGRMQLLLTAGSFGAILGSFGIRIAVTCLTAQESGRSRPGGVRTALRCCLLFGLTLSVLVALGLFLLSPLLARRWIGDQGALFSLRVLALSLPLTVVEAVLGGYYTAAGRIRALVASELGEKLVGIGLVILLLQRGFPDPCGAVFLGSGCSSLVCIWLLGRGAHRTLRQHPPLPWRPMVRELLHLTLPLGGNDILRSGLGALEHVLIPQGLQRSGLSQGQAMAEFGILSGMAFPVLTFPCVLLYALSDLLVPEMARCLAKGWRERIRFLADKCLRLTVLYGLGAVGLFLLLGDELGRLLFHSAQAGTYLRIYAPLMAMLFTDAITDGMLKGLSQQLHTVRYNTITSALDVGLLWVLLPRWGMGGFLWAFTLSHGLNFFLSLRRLLVVTGYRPTFHATLWGALSCGGALLIMELFPGDGSLWSTLLRGGMFLGGYGLCVLPVLGRQDLAWLWSLVRRKDRNSN